MKYLFVIAMEKEAKDVIKHYGLNKIDDNYYGINNIELVITDITRNGVTSSLINLLYKHNLDYRNYTMINIGMAGSNNLEIGSVHLVNRSYGYNFDLTPFGDPLYKAPYSPFKLNTLKCISLKDCYTSDGFVLETNIKEDALFDMELNGIITFPFNKKYSIKIVSDSLNNKTYESFNLNEVLPKVYELINKIMAE